MILAMGFSNDGKSSHDRETSWEISLPEDQPFLGSLALLIAPSQEPSAWVSTSRCLPAASEASLTFLVAIQVVQDSVATTRGRQSLSQGDQGLFRDGSWFNFKRLSLLPS